MVIVCSHEIKDKSSVILGTELISPNLATVKAQTADTLIDATMPERILQIARTFRPAPPDKDRLDDPLIKGKKPPIIFPNLQKISLQKPRG